MIKIRIHRTKTLGGQIDHQSLGCGYVANADFNASCNVLSAGHAVFSVEGGCQPLTPLDT